ncbi:MAG: thiamine phosphate synthase [Bacteroidia bacterium]
MVVVISNPTIIENEVALINQLFDAGLSVFHLRKPNDTLEETKKLLMKIEKQHHSKIALHQHHQLSENFDIKRLHYTEERRKNDKMKEIQSNHNFIYSTSIHQLKEYEHISDSFEYCFLSPIFNSISKLNYKSILTPDFKLPLCKKAKIIALGGIDIPNIDTVKKYDFNGIALLGSIWHNSKNAIQNFKRLKHKWEN